MKSMALERKRHRIPTYSSCPVQTSPDLNASVERDKDINSTRKSTNNLIDMNNCNSSLGDVSTVADSLRSTVYHGSTLFRNASQNSAAFSALPNVELPCVFPTADLKSTNFLSTHILITSSPNNFNSGIVKPKIENNYIETDNIINRKNKGVIKVLKNISETCIKIAPPTHRQLRRRKAKTDDCNNLSPEALANFSSVMGKLSATLKSTAPVNSSQTEYTETLQRFSSLLPTLLAQSVEDENSTLWMDLFENCRNNNNIKCVKKKIPKEIVGEENPSVSICVFTSIDVPSIRIDEYLKRLQTYFGCSTECFVICIVYLNKIVQKYPHIKITKYNIHRLVFAGVMLAAKFFDDVYFTNAHYAKVGGVHKVEANVLELAFLKIINYRLFFTSEEFEKAQWSILQSAQQNLHSRIQRKPLCKAVIHTAQHRYPTRFQKTHAQILQNFIRENSDKKSWFQCKQQLLHELWMQLQEDSLPTT